MQNSTSPTSPELYLDQTREELKWLERKLFLTSIIAAAQRKPVRRGEVYGCEYGYNLGSELRDYHKCVIVQNYSVAPSSNTVLVAPITHAANRTALISSSGTQGTSGQNPSTSTPGGGNFASPLVPITTQTDGQGNVIIEGYVDVAGIRAVSKARLKRRCICKLSLNDMRSIDEKIAKVFDVIGYYVALKKKYQAAIQRCGAREEKIRKLTAALTTVRDQLPETAIETIKKIVTDALTE